MFGVVVFEVFGCFSFLVVLEEWLVVDMCFIVLGYFILFIMDCSVCLGVSGWWVGVGDEVDDECSELSYVEMDIEGVVGVGFGGCLMCWLLFSLYYFMFCDILVCCCLVWGCLDGEGVSWGGFCVLEFFGLVLFSS